MAEQWEFPDRSVDMIRSEEHLRVGVSVRERGRVRISRRVVTEEQTFTVTLRREELVVTELPGDASAQASSPSPSPSDADPMTATVGADGRLVERSVADGVLDLVLHEERVVTSTVVVPIERVRIGVRTVSTLTDVGAGLAREVVVAETTDPSRARGTSPASAGRPHGIREDHR